MITVPREFYQIPALRLAPKLLGCILVHDSEEGLCAGEIIETEAYEGPHDRACHAWGGRYTRRTSVMFGPPGHAYVYFTYGMHWLFNVVAAPEGVPHAVLVRSIRPILGLDLMAERRRGMLPLAEGPGRLTQAMGIGRAEDEMDLVGTRLFIAEPEGPLPEHIVTKRVGIDGAGPARDYPWRFVVKGSRPSLLRIPYQDR